MTTTQTISTYVFDQAWQAELQRLHSIEELYDPASRRHLAETGVGDGWRCLELGSGAGSIACWLADRVGPSGHVLALDLDPRFMGAHGRRNLQVRKQDVVSDPPEPASFDLIHARAVLEHIRDRRTVFDDLVAALRPGGWLVIEDTDFGGTAAAMIGRYFVPERNAANGERMYEAVAKVMAAAGADPCFGPKLPGMFITAGLDGVGAEVHAPMVRGGLKRTFVELSVEQLRARVTAIGGQTDSEVDEALSNLADPEGGYLPPFLVSVWGRRAEERGPDR